MKGIAYRTIVVAALMLSACGDRQIREQNEIGEQPAAVCGKCDVDVLVEQAKNPRRLIVDRTHLYWRSDFGLRLSRAPRVGGKEHPVAEHFHWFDVDANSLYLMQSSAFVSRDLTRRTKDGTMLELLAQFDYKTFAPSNASFATDATHIYAFHPPQPSIPEDQSGLFKIEKQGAHLEKLGFHHKHRPTTLVALDESYIYLQQGPAGATDHHRLVRFPKAGGPAQVVTPLITDPNGTRADTFHVDDTHVYWAEHRDGKVDDPWGRVLRVAKAGGPVELVVDKQHFEVEFSLAGQYVYWRNAEREVFRTAKLDGTVTRLYQQPGRWLGVADGSAYFAVRHSHEQYEENYRIVRRDLCACPN